MKPKIKYTDEPLENLEVIADMLPSPEDLAFKEDTVKVTIALSKSSVDFFKREAKKHDTKYQQMIRRLLDAYTSAHDCRDAGDRATQGAVAEEQRTINH
jgi:predicted DNA binding CopG/RHH family protein